jgi:hypothetical protein
LFSFPIFIDVYGQQGSRDLMAEYCQNNWINDPVKCVDYVPSDYEANKAKYQAQEAEKAKQETPSNLAKESQRVCPLGSHLGTDNFGNQVCLDSKTNQVVGSTSTGQSDSGGNGVIIGIIVIILIVIVAGIAKSRGGTGQFIERKSFSNDVKQQVLRRQDHKCNSCGRLLNVVDYDHIDGNRANNDSSNCQALCPNCHAEKSRREQMGNANY